MKIRHTIKGAAALFAMATVTGIPVAGAQEVWETLPFPATFPEPVSSGYTDVNGIRLFHAEWGEGSPVILLHGGLGSIEAWAYQIPLMAEDHRAIAIDSRGHGRSTRDATTYSYALMASDVLALMDEMSIDQAAFVGWSDGGIIALELAINHPDRISKALVLGTNYNLEGIDHSVDTNAVFGEYVTQAAGLYAEISATPDGFDGFVNDISAMWGSQPDFSEDQLKAAGAPFTVVQALEDEAIIDEHAEKMAALLPAATYVPLDGVSHFAMWQDPERMNAVLADFLK